MLERKITGTILKAMRDDPQFGTCAVEVKVAKGMTLHKGALKEHQRRALELARGVGMYHKIIDGAGYGQLPFDGVVLKKCHAYLVIYYDKKPKHEVWALPIKCVPEGSISLEYAQTNGVRITLSRAS